MPYPGYPPPYPQPQYAPPPPGQAPPVETPPLPTLPAPLPPQLSPAGQTPAQSSPASLPVDLRAQPSGSASPVTPPVAPPAAKPAKAPFVPPPPPPPLSDPVALLTRSREALSQLVEAGNIDARPSRQGPAPPPKSGACTACRNAKAKCSQDEPRCTRCIHQNIECSYPVFNKRGRKRMMTPNQALLVNVHRDLEAALSLLANSGGSTPNRPSPINPTVAALRASSDAGSSSSSSPSASTAEHHEDEDETRRFKNVIESPLAVLAHISSLKVTESTEEESGKTFLPKDKAEAGPAEGYFATGLYQLRSDADPGSDPVKLGLLTEAQLDSLVAFYFHRLHPWFFHLSPSLHTPTFLRNVSPFLTTSLAYITATFQPELHHLVHALHEHVQRLSTRVWADGLKSLEIVQAYLLLIHWTPIEDDWGDDRRWGWLSQAVRIATEIKLYKPLNPATFGFYHSVTPLGEGAFEALLQMRAWSWKLISVTEIALCVSTGRTASVQGLACMNLGSLLPRSLPPDDPFYNITALIHLNQLYGKAIIHSNHLEDSDDAADSRSPEHRQAFKDSWQRDMQRWVEEWPAVNPVVRLIAQHNTTILLSIALRFKGPIQPVLDECRLSAFETAKLAITWEGDSINYASNLIVVNIAYAATLLLRILAAKGPIDPETRALCSAVADVLIRIGNLRPSIRTLATLHGTRIRTLLSADLPKHAAAAAASGAFPASDPCLVSPSAAAQAALTPSTFQSPASALSPTSSAALGAAHHGHPSSYLTAGLHLSAQSVLDPHNPHLHPLPSSSSSSTPVDPSAAATGATAGASVFNLPSTDSHLLWDLFNDAGAPHDPAHGALAGAMGDANGMLRPDAWVWKTANDQDWLSSEPGAWAW
ncbi:hypothetical protein JCM8097_004744 [Rhodosporidiobolus ruineniae]